jgi:transaldolase
MLLKHISSIMKFFIDTANLPQIREARDLGILDGVTTNPSLMARENILGHDAILAHYRQICEMVDGDVSAEVLATDLDGMLTEAAELVAVHKNIVVKIPCTVEGIKAIKALSAKNIPTNCTLVFNAGQAVLAAKAGARYVSPFVGRLDASIRHTRHIIDCMEAGAHVVTCPLKPILGLLDHPLTEKGLAKFVEDARKMI